MRAHHGSLSREQRLAGRVRAQGRPPARDRRDEQPRARHRHGHGRSRRARRVAGLGRARPAAHRARRPPGRRAEHRQDLPEVPRRPARGRGRRASACATGSSRRCATRATRSTCSRSRSSPRCAVDEWDVDELARARAPRARTSPSSPTTRSARRSTCSRAATPPTSSRACGRASCGTACEDRVRAREGAQRVAVASGGTIPDRGLFGVFLPDGARVGELDEEMVYESRVGETFVLGASTWRIEEITLDRVVVTPAPGEPAQDAVLEGRPPGRPLELGRALGALVRELRALPDAEAEARLRADGLDERAAANLRAYLDEQAEATGAVPDDRTIVDRALPRRDRRLARLHPHAVRRARARAVGARDRGTARRGSTCRCRCCGATTASSCRLPEVARRHPARRCSSSTPTSSTSSSSTRAAEHVAVRVALPRERGARAAAPPPPARRAHAAVAAAPARRRPARGRVRATRRSRSCSRRRASACATCSTCPRCARCSPTSASRKVRVVPVETRRASPFAQSPAVRLDRGRTCTRATRRSPNAGPPRSRSTATCSATCSAPRSCASCSTPRCSPSSSSSCSASRPSAQARHADDLHDLLADLGPLDARRARAPARRPIPRAVARHARCGERRVIRVGDRSRPREDAARLRDALGVALPPGLPAAFTDPVDHPLDDLVARYARTHVPFVDRRRRRPARRHRRHACATRSPRLEADGRVVLGEFRPGGVEREWCDAGVLRVAAPPLARRAAPRGRAGRRDRRSRASCPRGRASAAAAAALDALVEALEQLQGVAIPASVLERDVLPARVDGYRPGDARRAVRGRRARVDRRGRARRRRRPRAAASSATASACSRPAPLPDGRPTARCTTRSAARLAAAGASFWPDLVAAAGTADDAVRAHRAVGSRVGGRGHQRHVRPAARARGARRQRARRAAGRNPARLTRLGPPAGAGRWSLVAPLLEPAPTPTETAHAHRAAAARTPRRRDPRGRARRGHRRRVRRASIPVLRALEESGRARRGWFVAGLGAAQFALPGAVDRLRAHPHTRRRRTRRVVVLAATDPAQPYGAALAWPDGPGRPARAAGAHVVLVDGALAAYLERGGKSLAHVRLDRRATCGPTRSSRRTRRAASAGSRSNASTTSPRARHRSRPRCARPASPTATKV